MTAIVSAVGAILGALFGAGLLACVVLVQEGPAGFRHSRALFESATLVGAGAGAILAPLASWSLMRYVPIWRAIADTTLGAALGAFVGYWLSPLFGLGLVWPVGMGIIGFLVASVRLRLSYRTNRLPGGAAS